MPGGLFQSSVEARPVIGIDPGLSGALALIRADGSMELRDIPVEELKPRPMLHLDRTARIFRGWSGEGAEVWLELVGSRPTDGHVGAFCFGGMFWALRALAAANRIPLNTVAPVRWRRAMGLAAGDDKNKSRAKAAELMPRHAHLWQRQSDDGRAEAVLIGLYGQRQPARAAA